jgi:hypothetical protein
VAKTKQLVKENALRVIDIEPLKIDPSYQRELKPSHQKIADNYVKEAIGIPLVGEREDGSLWIVDGQQRVAGLRKMGRGKVRVEVFRSDGPEHEAKVFRLVNKERVRLSSGELFHAALAEGDQLAWQIKDCVEACGFTLKLGSGAAFTARTRVPGISAGSKHGEPSLAAREVTCVSMLIEVTKKFGLLSLRFALDTIAKAWDNDPQATYNVIVYGLAAMHAKYKGGIDVDRLVRNLQTTTCGKIVYTSGLGTEDRKTAVLAVFERLYRKRVAPNAGR